MNRRCVNQLGEHEQVDEVFLVAEKQLRTNRAGSLYLQLRLADRTGAVTAMLWNANDDVYGSFDTGGYLRVQGKSQLYNGAMQLILSHIEPVAAENVDEVEFVTLPSADVAGLRDRLAEQLGEVRNVHLRRLAESFLQDDELMAKFCRAPAGVKLHHAYQGGLLKHVVHLLDLVAAVAPLYPEVDEDLLRLGAFVHDIGKVDELAYERELAYTDEGQLVGHLVMGVSILEQAARRVHETCGEEMPAELLVRLKHMIVSHHGSYEFGSPKLPMTPEAVALHYLDTLDAKIYSVVQLMDSDVNVDSAWTPYHANLGRKLFKGHGSSS